MMAADYRELRLFLMTGKYDKPGLSQGYLAYAWGVNKDAPREAFNKQCHGVTRHFRRLENSGRTVPEAKTMRCVIECRESARSVYTPFRLYRMHSLNRYKRDNSLNLQSKEDAKKYDDNAFNRWKKLPRGTKDRWYAEARHHDSRWPEIRDCIILLLQNNASISYAQLSQQIGGWCSAKTIHKWLVSQVNFSYYNERIIPLLTTAQRAKHVAFSRHLRNHWGFSREKLKKVLFIHYDEKWFYGMVTRSHGKKCDNLPVYRKHMNAYHKNYINKVMLIAVTGYAFEDSIERGGDGLKLGLIRVQAAKVAKKTVRESTRDEEGQIRYNGEIKRRPGDCFMVETTVTGSNSGMSSDPKFSLLACFKRAIFPKVETVVGPGGPYAGYVPVIQGDNAGPHQDREFLEWTRDYCSERGWLWEPQAPQMPYSNNLDLTVFPCMSKRHTELLSKHGNRVASCDEIYSATEQVWRDIPSSTIAGGFVLAHRIAGKVIEEDGDNKFLSGADFHSGVRNDFINTDKGIGRKKGH